MTIPVGSIVSLKQGAYSGILSYIVSKSNGPFGRMRLKLQSLQQGILMIIGLHRGFRSFYTNRRRGSGRCQRRGCLFKCFSQMSGGTRNPQSFSYSSVVQAEKWMAAQGYDGGVGPCRMRLRFALAEPEFLSLCISFVY
jgi:hypothetical protein